MYFIIKQKHQSHVNWISILVHVEKLVGVATVTTVDSPVPPPVDQSGMVWLGLNSSIIWMFWAKNCFHQHGLAKVFFDTTISVAKKKVYTSMVWQQFFSHYQCVAKKKKIPQSKSSTPPQHLMVHPNAERHVLWIHWIYVIDWWDICWNSVAS